MMIIPKKHKTTNQNISIKKPFSHSPACWERAFFILMFLCQILRLVFAEELLENGIVAPNTCVVRVTMSPTALDSTPSSFCASAEMTSFLSRISLAF